MESLGIRAARRLLELRKHLGWKQTKMLDVLGVSQPHLSKIERLKAPASYELIETASKKLNISPLYFFADDPAPYLNMHNRETRDIELDHLGRSKCCLNCGATDFDESIRYCLMCRFPLYNFCISEIRHTNPPHAKFCGTCGEPTFWGMSKEDLEQIEVPPDVRSTHKNEAVHGKR